MSRTTERVLGQTTRSTRSSYRPSGELASQRRPNGIVEQHFFSSDGLASLTRHEMAGQAPEEEAYAYDANANRTQDENGSSLFNARGQLTAWTRPADAAVNPGQQASYRVNGSGALERESDGASITTYKNQGERMPSKTTNGAKSSYQYNEFGSLTRESRAAGAEQNTHSYDPFQRLTGAEGFSGPGKTSFTYDGLERRDVREETQTDGSKKRYDLAYVGASEALSREVTPAGSGEQTALYDYDSSGERQGQTTRGGQGPGSRSYRKDANGTVIGLEGQTGAVATNERYQYKPYGELESDPGAMSSAAKANPLPLPGLLLRLWDQDLRHASAPLPTRPWPLPRARSLRVGARGPEPPVGCADAEPLCVRGRQSGVKVEWDGHAPNRYEAWFCSDEVNAIACAEIYAASRKACRAVKRMSGNGATKLGTSRANTFQHGLWVALMAERVRKDKLFTLQQAKSFLYRHEKADIVSGDPGRIASARMDLHNNRVALRFARANPGHNFEYYCAKMLSKARHAKRKRRDGFYFVESSPRTPILKPSGCADDDLA